MRFFLTRENEGRLWKGAFLFALLSVLAQVLVILFYQNLVAYRIESAYREFEENANTLIGKGNFNLVGFSGNVYLFENGTLKRWNNAEFSPPSYFTSEEASIGFSRASKKYLVLFKKSHISDGQKVDLISILPLFQEAPRGNSIFGDIVNSEIFLLGGIGPDSFEENDRPVSIGEKELFRFSVDYRKLVLPVWLRLYYSFILIVLVFALFRPSNPLRINPASPLRFFMIWLYSFLFSAIWLGFHTDLFLFGFFIALFFALASKGPIGLRLDEIISSLSRNLRMGLFILLSLIFSWILSNWINIHDSSYLGLNAGLEKGSIIQFLVYSSAISCYILVFPLLLKGDDDRRSVRILAVILVVLSIILILLFSLEVGVWLLAASVILGLGEFKRIQEPGINLASRIMVFVLFSAFISGKLALDQRLEQFEQIINAINDPNQNRVEAELAKAKKGIKKDPLVHAAFRRSLGSFRSSEKKVLNHHFKTIRLEYDVNLMFFDHQDRNLQPTKSTLNLDFYRNRYNSDGQKMPIGDLHIENNALGQIEEFLLMAEIVEDEKKVGTVLAMGKKRGDYGYGFGPLNNTVEGLSFNSTHWPYSSFKLSRERGIIWEDWVESEEVKKELADSIYTHFDMQGSLAFDKYGFYLRGVVFGETGFGLVFPSPGFLAILGNVLILLMVIMAYFMISLLINAVNTGVSGLRLNLQRKMQLLYFFAITVPMAILTLVMFVSLSRSFEENIQAKDQLKAKNLFDLSKINFKAFLDGELSRSDFVNATKSTAESQGLNISIYDQSGTVFYTDFLNLYKSHVFSPLIDPQLYFDQPGFDMNYKKVNRAKVNFGTVILPLATENGQPYYYLFVPFFDNYKKVQREQERLGIVSLGFFSLFTFLFLMLAYFFTKRLLLPLDLLSGQLKDVRLTESPSPIDWSQDDEIGEVVKSYNLMISKLVESREALSIAKQDEAWKEMAKQVAHEIKNPLTPMRLRIQQVISSLRKNEKDGSELVRYLEDALGNIDLVKETANSFHGFASIPEPENRHMDLGELVKQVISPFRINPSSKLDYFQGEGDYSMNADPKILGGAFLNLILNGIQSVPTERNAYLKVSLEKGEGFYELRFQDNGVGVPDTLKEKIFEAYYTTKKSGSGLGLQIVKRAIEIYNGKIELMDAEPNGTIFSIKFPLT